MSNAINAIQQREKAEKEQKIKDLKASISIAQNTIRLVENSDIKGRESFIVIDSLSWLHTIKSSLDQELLKVEPKKDDPKKEGEPTGPATTENGKVDVEKAPTDKTLEVVK